MDLPWWQRGAVYQIYPRSFADSDGDGSAIFRAFIATCAAVTPRDHPATRPGDGELLRAVAWFARRAAAALLRAKRPGYSSHPRPCG